MRHLCDANVFFAIALDAHRHHVVAAHWFDALGKGDTAEFCRLTQLAFLRLLTTKEISGDFTLTNREAHAVWETFQSDERVRLAGEPVALAWLDWAAPPSRSPKLWNDAYLAAFAAAHGMRLVTFDSGFRQFERRNLDLLVLTR